MIAQIGCATLQLNIVHMSYMIGQETLISVTIIDCYELAPGTTNRTKETRNRSEARRPILIVDYVCVIETRFDRERYNANWMGTKSG